MFLDLSIFPFLMTMKICKIKVKKKKFEVIISIIIEYA